MNITDGQRSFSVDKRESILLELMLNKSEYGRTWIHIGDILFDYGAHDKAISEIVLTSFQYDYLHNIYRSL